MDTDVHGSKTKDLSVSIRVNPWLKLGFSVSCQAALKGVRDACESRSFVLLILPSDQPASYQHRRCRNIDGVQLPNTVLPAAVRYRDIVRLRSIGHSLVTPDSFAINFSELDSADEINPHLAGILCRYCVGAIQRFGCRARGIRTRPFRSGDHGGQGRCSQSRNKHRTRNSHG